MDQKDFDALLDSLEMPPLTLWKDRIRQAQERRRESIASTSINVLIEDAFEEGCQVGEIYKAILFMNREGGIPSPGAIRKFILGYARSEEALKRDDVAAEKRKEQRDAKKK